MPYISAASVLSVKNGIPVEMPVPKPAAGVFQDRRATEFQSLLGAGGPEAR